MRSYSGSGSLNQLDTHTEGTSCRKCVVSPLMAAEENQEVGAYTVQGFEPLVATGCLLELTGAESPQVS